MDKEIDKDEEIKMLKERVEVLTENRRLQKQLIEQLKITIARLRGELNKLQWLHYRKKARLIKMSKHPLHGPIIPHNINQTRNILYSSARSLGDVNAIENGRVVPRIERRVVGRSVSRALLGQSLR